ncbi:MAG: Hsp20/alpha crystallin family protein [Candidatus Moranbacteria bacterium]|nr:Hsp20/alpha crystallin family protein [Candidatus Moranbacteria bacterium]
MTKVKKSFLERLTGARTIEDDAYIPERSISPSVNMYGNEEEEIEMDREITAHSSTPNQFSRESREEIQSNELESNEGQLTIDVYQTDSDIVIKSTIAGVKPEDLDVSINNDMLTIRGERKNEEQVMEENYYYQECYWGSFSRSVILPIDVVADKIEASMKNGILTVRMPKAESNKAKKIQVRGF